MEQQAQAKDPQESEVSHKTVLVCFGERKREVTFSSASGKEGDISALLDAVANVFADVLPSENPTQQLILQSKNEHWDGEFVDAEGEIADKSVLRAVRMGELGGGPSCETRLQGESDRITCKALSSLKRVAKPSGACVEKLAKMFPASKIVPLKRPDAFDPLEACVALPAQKKKKSTRIKCVNVTVVVVPKEASSILPKGKKRQKLVEERRVQTIELKRTMSPDEVQSRIKCGFAHLQLTKWEYLEVSAGHLIRASNQNIGGEIVDRRGALYIQENDKECQQATSGSSSSSPSLSLTKSPMPGDPVEVSSDSDSDLPPITVTEKGRESIEETRRIRAQQDWEYQESLRMDRERETQARKERNRAERVQVLRELLKEKLAASSLQDGRKIFFRLPNGMRIDSIFPPDSSNKALYEYVFSNSSITGPFGVFSTYPRCLIRPDKLIGGTEGILTVEEGQGLIDPLTLGEMEEDSTDDDTPPPSVESSAELLQQADEDRVEFMQSLSLGPGLTHTVQRSDIFNGVISLYENNHEQILQEYPFRIRFQGERAVDLGGVARDMFSAFYEEAYERLFDGSSLLCPIVHPEMNMSVLSTVGFVISHAYMVTGILPVRIAFPCLAQSLLGTSQTIPTSAMVEAFQDCISAHESNIVKVALEEVKQQLPTFSSSVMSGLLSLLSNFNSRQAPTPERFHHQIANVATYEFLIKPTAALAMIHSGVPQQHHPFWSRMGVTGLLSLYQAQSACPATVLSMIEDAEGQNSTQERILGYLRQFIGNMGSDELRTFLRFVTGSSVCSSLKIQVEFNMLSGAARRPIAHTCTPSLELPSTYGTYLEFVSEFRKCIANEYSWIMDGI